MEYHLVIYLEQKWIINLISFVASVGYIRSSDLAGIFNLLTVLWVVGSKATASHNIWWILIRLSELSAKF
jgi:hypothetical protein